MPSSTSSKYSNYTRFSNRANASNSGNLGNTVGKFSFAAPAPIPLSSLSTANTNSSNMTSTGSNTSATRGGAAAVAGARAAPVGTAPAPATGSVAAVAAPRAFGNSLLLPGQHLYVNPSTNSSKPTTIGSNTGVAPQARHGQAAADPRQQQSQSLEVKPGPLDRVITYAELESRPASQPPWMLIDTTVYDLDGFLDQHPGGRRALLQYINTDATVPFHKITGHRFLPTQRLLRERAIGRICPVEHAAREAAKLKNNANAAGNGSNSSNSNADGADDAEGGLVRRGLLTLIAREERMNCNSNSHNNDNYASTDGDTCNASPRGASDCDTLTLLFRVEGMVTVGSDVPANAVMDGYSDDASMGLLEGDQCHGGPSVVSTGGLTVQSLPRLPVPVFNAANANATNACSKQEPMNDNNVVTAAATNASAASGVDTTLAWFKGEEMPEFITKTLQEALLMCKARSTPVAASASPDDASAATAATSVPTVSELYGPVTPVKLKIPTGKHVRLFTSVLTSRRTRAATLTSPDGNVSDSNANGDRNALNEGAISCACDIYEDTVEMTSRAYTPVCDFDGKYLLFVIKRYLPSRKSATKALSSNTNPNCDITSVMTANFSNLQSQSHLQSQSFQSQQPQSQVPPAARTVSSSLHALPLGATVFCSLAPLGSYTPTAVITGRYARIVCLAAGTGVAPLYALAARVVNNRFRKPGALVFVSGQRHWGRVAAPASGSAGGSANSSRGDGNCGNSGKGTVSSSSGASGEATVLGTDLALLSLCQCDDCRARNTAKIQLQQQQQQDQEYEQGQTAVLSSGVRVRAVTSDGISDSNNNDGLCASTVCSRDGPPYRFLPSTYITSTAAADVPAPALPPGLQSTMRLKTSNTSSVCASVLNANPCAMVDINADTSTVMRDRASSRGNASASCIASDWAAELKCKASFAKLWLLHMISRPAQPLSQSGSNAGAGYIDLSKGAPFPFDSPRASALHGRVTPALVRALFAALNIAPAPTANSTTTSGTGTDVRCSDTASFSQTVEGETDRLYNHTNCWLHRLRASLNLSPNRGDANAPASASAAISASTSASAVVKPGEGTLVLICGPDAFAQEMEATVRAMGFAPENPNRTLFKF